MTTEKKHEAMRKADYPILLAYICDYVLVNTSHVASWIAINEYENIVQSDPFDNGPEKEDCDSHHGRVTHYYGNVTTASFKSEGVIFVASYFLLLGPIIIPDKCKSEWLLWEKKGGSKKKGSGK